MRAEIYGIFVKGCTRFFMLTNDVLSFYAQIDDVPDDGHSTSAGLDHFNCYLDAASFMRILNIHTGLNLVQQLKLSKYKIN